MKNISKTFPGVKALSNVDFTLREGEIHALMGENGAGKSTLIKVLTGVHGFEEGQIVMEGNRTIVNNSPQDAQKNGISTVYQEVNLCPNLTVAENLFIGREPRKCGMIDWRTMNRKSAEVLKSLDINVSPSSRCWAAVPKVFIKIIGVKIANCQALFEKTLRSIEKAKMQPNTRTICERNACMER